MPLPIITIELDEKKQLSAIFANTEISLLVICKHKDEKGAYNDVPLAININPPSGPGAVEGIDVSSLI